MTARLAIAAASLCLLGSIGAPVNAEPLVFSVTADKAASARFHLPTDTTLSFDQASVVTAADYAGLALYSDDGRLVGGILTAPAMSAAGHDRDPVFLGPAGSLRQGWYRVVVLANAATTIRIPVLAGSGVSVAATTPNAQAFKVLTKTLPAGGRTTAELRAPLPRSTATSRLALLTRLSPAVVDGKVTALVCASQRGKPCGTRDTKATQTIDKSGVNATRMIQTGISTPGRYITGTRDALARVTLTPVTSVPFSFLFVHWADPLG